MDNQRKMLKMAGETTLFEWHALRDFETRLLTKVGLPECDSATEADAPMWANLRGVDSHGVVRIPWSLGACPSNGFEQATQLE